jgi:hypothetical protein
VGPLQTYYYLVVPGIEPWTSGSVARNSDHWTTEAVTCYLIYQKNNNQVISKFESLVLDELFNGFTFQR